MIDPANLNVILGPAVCRSCSARVVYGTARIRGNSGNIKQWRDPATGRKHVCLAEREID